MTHQFLAVTTGSIYGCWATGHNRNEAISNLKAQKDWKKAQAFEVYEVDPAYQPYVNEGGTVCGKLREGQKHPQHRWYWVAV
jgi:siderophore synthetase component